VKLSVPTGDVAVMLPKTMQFTPTTPFQPITDPSMGNSSQNYDAHSPAFAQPVQFTVAGTGQLPDDNGPVGAGQSGNNGQPDQTAQTASSQRPGGGLGAPEDPNDTNDTLSKYKWWIISLLGLVLATGAGIMLKSSPAVAVAGAAPPVGDATEPYAPASPAGPVLVTASGTAPLLQALKDELFELETDRLSGRLSDTQYAEQKAAFDVVLRRALTRTES
jgi:hypothetical protein